MQNYFLVEFLILFKMFMTADQISLLEGAVANCGVSGNVTSFFLPHYNFWWLVFTRRRDKKWQNL